MVDKKINRNLVLLASVMVNLCVGAVYAFSVLAGPLGEKFGWSKAVVMTAFTINAAISPIPMILGGKLLDRGLAKLSIIGGGALFGLGFMLTGFVKEPIHLYLAYGVLGGLGQGIAYSGTIGNTVKLFPDKKGLATGIVTAGFGGATILAAPIANNLIQNSGVLSTFKIMGIAYMVITIVFGLLITAAPAGYKPEGWNPPTISSANGSNVNVNWIDMIKTSKFYIIASMFTIGALSGMMITSNASIIGQTMFGLSAAIAALYVSLYSFSNCMGRIFWGAVSDKLGRYNALICIYTVVAAMLLVLATTHSVVGFAIGLIGIGLCFGGTLGIFPSIVAEKFGMKYYGVNYGITFIGYSAAAFFGPKIAVQVAGANNGSFTNAFYIALVLSLVGIALTTLFIRIEKNTANKNLAA
ncbi:L-lactate MFS transporter [Clostridium intestinale]|uniref:Major facilitator family transporter n=1 Tax=Clostridium intestinale URNW TaxID=1294142 RepID=U2PXQ2_9CLOT|nr:OFA family MFS transporter [Clostridium intestinale]ERK28554.1 major facilitator family transporter [Clostridium intestinale URNW]